jgi:hypothetical protein
MKNLKYIFLIASLFVCFGVTAEVKKINKEIICSSIEEMDSAITEWQEQEVWTGYSPEEKTLYTFSYNQKSRSWSIIQYDNNVACLIGSGVGSAPENKKNKKMVDTNG